MLNRLASQMNLISTSPSSEISDQCFLESSFFPETGSLCQSGGNPVLMNLCAKYLSSPFRMRSASSTASCGFQGMSLRNLPFDCVPREARHSAQRGEVQKRISENFVCASGHTLRALRGYGSSTMFSVDDLSIDRWAFASGSIPSVCARHSRGETAASASRVTKRGIEDCENY